MTERKVNKRPWILAGIIASVALVFLILGVIFSLKEVKVEGNERYTEEQVRQLIVGDGYTNTLLLLAKSKFKGFGTLPFISTVEVRMTGSNSVAIRIYEKAIVGYVSYLGSNLYFDKDGIVSESSQMVLEGVPQITGLSFKEVTLHEQLPVTNRDVFRLILTLTQTLDKNEITPDRIYVSKNGEMTLYFNEAKVLLGNETLLEEKIANLASFVDDLTERSGTLHMENYTEDTKNFIFDGK